MTGVKCGSEHGHIKKYLKVGMYLKVGKYLKVVWNVGLDPSFVSILKEKLRWLGHFKQMKDVRLPNIVLRLANIVLGTFVHIWFSD